MLTAAVHMLQLGPKCHIVLLGIDAAVYCIGYVSIIYRIHCVKRSTPCSNTACTYTALVSLPCGVRVRCHGVTLLTAKMAQLSVQLAGWMLLCLLKSFP